MATSVTLRRERAFATMPSQETSATSAIEATMTSQCAGLVAVILLAPKRPTVTLLGDVNATEMEHALVK